MNGNNKEIAVRKKGLHFGKADTTKLLLAAIFISMVFLPLIRMFLHMDAKSISGVLSSPNFASSVCNSLIATVIATVITIILAFVAAICVERTKIKFKGLFSILFVLPMLVPSISNGMGLVILFGNNGIFTKLFNVNLGIYGLKGIVLGSVLYAFPVAFLMFSDIIKYEDGTPYEAAKVLGLSKIRQFMAITLPYMRKPLITVIFSTFTLIVTDYGVPLMVGGKFTTVPVVMYQQVIGQLDFGKGSVYGSILLIPAVIAFIIDIINRDRGNSAFVARKYEPSNGKLKKVVSYVICGLCALYTLLPIFSFIVLAFAKDYPNNVSFTLDNFQKAIRLRADDYLLNSIIIALLVSLAGIVISFLTAYMAARMKSKTSMFLHLSAMTSAAIPGIVLGLSYVLTFKESYIYGTIIILVMVNLVHFIASPYLMIYNSLSKVNENLEAVAFTLGINRIHMIKDVFLPMCKNTLFEMFSYFFVNCMITISAVSFLANTANKPVALMINQFEAQLQLECAAIVSLMILAVNLILKGIFHLLKLKRKWR